MEIFEVGRAEMELANKSGSSGHKDSCTSYFRARRHIKRQAWLTNWVVDMSTTTEIESQRKSWFRWWHNRIESVSLDAEYSITQTFRSPWGYEWSETTEDSYSHAKYNAAEIRKNLTRGVAVSGVIRVTGWISSIYTGNRSDGETTSCTTYVSK